MKTKITGRCSNAETRFALFSLFALCILLACSEPASAEATSKISDYFYTDDTFVLNDKIGIMNVNSYEEVVIDYDGSFIVVRNNTCERVINNNFCVDSVVYDTSTDKKKARLVVYYLGPDIKLTRSLNKSNPLIGEGVKITANIKNEGNTSARNLTYTDLFPPEIEVLKVKEGYAKIEKVLVWGNDTGAWQNMTRVFWQGEILAGKSQDITYTLRPTGYIDSKFTARAIYFDGIKNIEEISSPIVIETVSFFDIEKKFAPTDYSVSAGAVSLTAGESKVEAGVGEEFLFIAEITNEALKNESINISYVDFHVPDGMMYVEPVSFRVYTNASDANASYTPGLHRLNKVGENTYRWQGLLGPDDLVFAIKLKGTKEGNKRLTIDAHLVQFDEKKGPYYTTLYEEKYYGYEEINIKLNAPTIESNFQTGQTFDAGQQAYFTIYMQNPNEYANFTSMKVVLDTPWEKKNMTYRNLKKTDYMNFFDGFVTIPSVESSTSKSFSVNATYYTEYGDMYSVKLERTISIKPHSPIQISHSFSTSKGYKPGMVVIDNGEVLVTLKLANMGNSKIDHINVTEAVSPALSKEGNLTRIVNIDKSATMDVLAYKIDPPDLKSIEEYRTTTYVDYVAGNETYHAMKDIIVNVNPKKLSLDLTKTSQTDTAAMGVPFYVDYLVENTAGEALENITLFFPVTEGFDVIGSRHYTIKSLGKGEGISVVGQEKIRPKINSTSLRLERTTIVFHDVYGNEFTGNSSQPSIEVLHKPLQSPALKVVRNISKTTVNQSEKFSVSTSVENIGTKDTRASVNDLGRVWEIEIGAGKKKSFTYEASEDRAGEIELPPAVVNYTFGGDMYCTASNRNGITVIGVVEEVVEEVREEIVEEVVEEVKEEKKRPYLKYIALAAFIMLVCLIIFSVIKMKPKDERFEFLEE